MVRTLLRAKCLRHIGLIGKNGEVIMKGVTHYLPNGKKYTGKTHSTNGKLMTGAKHTPSSKPLTHKKTKK
jgi:hypothetical protein